MDGEARAPAGPRGLIGAAAEDAAAAYLRGLGWTLVARNLRIGPDELDIVALEPGAPASLVTVEVRSRSGPRFGSAIESVDWRKVRRLYRATLTLQRFGHPLIDPVNLEGSWRVDLVALRRRGDAGWRVEQHLRGLRPR